MIPHPLDAKAKTIFLAALNEHRQGELLEHLYAGGDAIVTRDTARLALIRMKREVS